ncbi:NADH-quinone oxidoreductase subunit C [Thiovibrio sp. JS02]
MKLNAIKQALAAISPEAMVEAEYAKKGCLLDVTVSAGQVVDAVTVLDREGFFIEAITGVDWFGEKENVHKEAVAAARKKAQDAGKAAAKKVADEGGDEEAQKAAQKAAEAAVVVPADPAEPFSEEMEVVYDFNNFAEFCRVVLRTRVPRGNPEVPTISHIYAGANWHERETHDFFGIKFVGHPYLVPLLLPEDADFHPLKKDFHV